MSFALVHRLLMFQGRRGFLTWSSDCPVTLAKMYLLALSPKMVACKSHQSELSGVFIAAVCKLWFPRDTERLNDSYSTEINPSLLLTALDVPRLSFNSNEQNIKIKNELLVWEGEKWLISRHATCPLKFLCCLLSQSGSHSCSLLLVCVCLLFLLLWSAPSVPFLICHLVCFGAFFFCGTM